MRSTMRSHHQRSHSSAPLALLGYLLAAASIVQAQYSATYYPSPSGVPDKTENGQSGTNNCGTGESQTSQCQNLYINSIDDWCLFAPPNGGNVADNERVEVSWCTQGGRGTRVIPAGTITGAHFLMTPSYVQITATGDFTKLGITPGDAGGELDPHGADGNGNPIGGLVFHNGQQMHEWFSFLGASDVCTRACYDGNRATSLCRHTYDELGCGFNAPGNYGGGFDTCDGQDAQDIMYGYPGLSTFQQMDTTNGVQVPSPHPAPASSNCRSQATINGGEAAYPTPSASKKTSSTTSSSSTSSSSSSSSSSTSSSSSSSTSSSTTSSSSSSQSVVIVTETSQPVAVSTPLNAGSSNAAASGASAMGLVFSAAVAALASMVMVL